MKIAYIANLTIPSKKASGYQITKMCEEFVMHGHDITLYLPTRQKEIDAKIHEHYGLKKNFRVQMVKSFDFLKWHPYIGTLSFHMQTVWFLIKLLFQKIDKKILIYSRQPEIIWLFGLRGYTTVFEVHRLSENQLGLFQFLTKRATRVVTVTKGLKNLYEKDVHIQDILVAPDGVDMEIFGQSVEMSAARTQLGLPAADRIAGYFGQFRTMGMAKGIDTILEAIKKEKDIHFLCVGGTPEDIDFYSAKAMELGISDRVTFKSAVDRKKLAVYQQACDMLLMPFPNTTHFAHFMSPLKMFEYMAARRPIIASNLPSIKEVLHDGKNAILVGADDPDALAHAMHTLRDSNLAERIAQQAYNDVQKYTWHKRAGDIIEFIS